MSATQQGQQQMQVDLSQQASVTLPLFQWNAVLGCLRTGHGEQFTWDLLNPLVTTISNQLQQEMQTMQQRQQEQPAFQKGLQSALNPERPNGEARSMLNVPTSTTE